MHLLFISSNRIGDSLINLQVLNKYIRKYKKNIEVTLVSGPLPMPIYDDYSMISRRINLTKQKYNLLWLKLYKELSPLKFDEIVDFRSSIIGYFLRVKKRNIFKMKKGKNIYEQIHHRFDTDLKKDFKILIDRVRNIFPNSNYVCLAPFTNWPPKEWPSEQFVKIAKYLIEKGIDKIFILGSENESSKFHHFESELGDKVINRCGKQHILNDYGLLQKSRLFIGNECFAYSIAEGLKIPRLLEASPDFPVIFPVGEKAYDFYHQVHFEMLFKIIIEK